MSISVPSSAISRHGIWLVILGSALWGTDALFRLPLTGELSPVSIVFAEHAILLLVTLPWLPRVLREARAHCRPSDWVALVLIGAGASALATVLFTMAFEHGGPITPVALQKLQPIFVAAAATMFLGERLRPRYGVFLAAALGSAWLVSFPEPFAVSINGVNAAALTIGAAALWGGGTVAGRYVSARLSFGSITVLRVVFGFCASLALVVMQGERVVPNGADVPGLVGLALVPGLFALLLYYRGLRSTPASRATLGELAFPATAAAVGVVVLGARLDGSQWTGLALLAITIVVFGCHETKTGKSAVRTAGSTSVVEAGVSTNG